MNDLMKENDTKNINFILKIMVMKFDHLCGASNVLDQKIGISIGFIATIIAGLGVLFKDFLNFNNPILVFGLLIIFFSLLILIFALKTKDYKYPPDAGTLYSKEYLQKSNIELKNQIISDIKKSFEDNCNIQQKKAKLFDLFIFLLIIGIMLVIINLFFGLSATGKNCPV